MVDVFRVDYAQCRELLSRRLAEPAPGRIQLITGPRQVGKTTLLLEMLRDFADCAHYAAVDSPEAALSGYWDRLWSRGAEIAQRSGSAILLIDEIQHSEGWAERLKAEWDRLRRLRLKIHVVVTGSSALGLTSGSKESLAGRFERLILTHWSAAALSQVFHLDPELAADVIVSKGGYPGAFELREDLSRWSAYVRDAIVEPAIGTDILGTTAVRRPALLRQVFAMAVALPAQIVSLQKLQGELQDRGALETIAHYLHVLQEAYLIAALEKHASKPLRRRAAPPKLVTLNNALCAVVDPRGIPDPQDDPERFGTWVENACLAFAWNSGQRVAYWREESFEVDGVIDGSWGSWAIEVKTGSYTATDLRGLFEFTTRFPGYRPLVVCDPSDVSLARRYGAQAMGWKEFLLSGPPNPST